MNKIFKIFACTLCVMALVSCSNGTTDDNNSLSNKSGSSSANSQDSWAYTSSSPVYTIDSSTGTLTISGLTSGKNKLFLVKTNPGSSSISSSASGYVTATSGVSSSSASTLLADTLVLDTTSSDKPLVNCFIPPQKLEPHDVAQALTGLRSVSASVLSVSASTVATTTANTTYAVGDTKKIYVDQDSDLSTYGQETATLRAVGTHCYVWVVNDYYSTTAGGDKVDSTIAEKYAKLFDTIYPMEKTVFGYESDDLLQYSNGSLSKVAMSGYDTGTMINIVIYDIANDYTASSGSTSGIVGYFYCKDYYTSSSIVSSNSGYSIINDSNKGKYFYIDSYYANAYLNTTYSTLAHEFQHMINFGVKDMQHDVSPSTWYNEMLSMLCEDMMQDKLGIADADSPKERLATFNQYYYYSGVTDYLTTNTSYTLISYSTAYAFGAWLCRWYGGANLVSKIMANDSVDEESIATAVSEVVGSTVTFDQILAQYVKSLIFDDTTLGQPTFNQSASDSSQYVELSYTNTDSSVYKFPMSAINLWDASYKWTLTSSKSSSTSTSYTGPALLACGSGGRTTIRPTGFTLHTIGTASSDTVVLTVSQPSSTTEVMYVMVE